MLDAWMEARRPWRSAGNAQMPCPGETGSEAPLAALIQCCTSALRGTMQGGCAVHAQPGLPPESGTMQQADTMHGRTGDQRSPAQEGTREEGSLVLRGGRDDGRLVLQTLLEDVLHHSTHLGWGHRFPQERIETKRLGMPRRHFLKQPRA